MNWTRFRATTAALLFAGLLVGSLVATPTANAAITASSVTTPTDQTYFIGDNDATSTTFAIAGTTSGGTPGVDMVDIRCYGDTTSVLVAGNVPLNADGSFSVPAADLSTLEDGLCQLRAVPAGTTPADVSPFAGPRIGIGERDTQTVGSGPNIGLPYDYYLWSQQPTAAFDYHSLGYCGLYDGYLFDAFALTTTTFYCNAGLFDEESSTPSRSELQIDGVNAYPPDVAEDINSNATPGLPALSYSYSLDPATGNLVIHETDPLVKCPLATYPPDSTSCPSFASAGVTDNRTITQDHLGHISWISDVFTSTDGQAHALDLLWDNAQHFQNGSGDSSQLEYEFPGQSSFAMHGVGDTVSLPAAGPGTITVRMHGAADGDESTGVGAIVYDRPAAGATFTASENSYSDFYLHQTGTVPAGGSTRFRVAYVQDYLAANVASLAQTASNAFLSPLTVSKAGTGSGTVTSSPGGISCGSACSQAYSAGTSVTLTATPATGSSFAGWSGACSGTGTCTVTMNDATAVTATFSIIPEQLTVARKGDGKGTVTSYPAGISCGKACSHSFDYGTAMIMRAKAAKGSSFAGWSGSCKGKSCTLLMNGAKSLKATFVKNCTVPKLKGKSLKAARRLLKSHDCRLGKIKRASSRKVKKGRVISSKPKAGKHLKHGAKIRLVLSK